MRVLGIESSCDETALAIYEGGKGLLAHALYSQSTHAHFGGVVPELASRDHVKQLVPLLQTVLQDAKLSCSAIDAIDGIAYTAGPGLIGALLTGACFAKSLAFALNKPALALHHLEAHVLAAQLSMPELSFPFLALLVSGGHSQFIRATALGQYEIIGETLDDAVGEAFDKVGKLIGIDYPGGAKLAKLADGCPQALVKQLAPFPCPLIERPGLDLSFSGLKTHALYAWNKSKKDDNARYALAYRFQEAVIKTLTLKCKRALSQTGLKRLVLAGGVGANLALRLSLAEMVEQNEASLFIPDPIFCTDNGAMVAYAGFLHFSQGKKDSDLGIPVKARWPFEALA